MGMLGGDQLLSIFLSFGSLVQVAIGRWGMGIPGRSSLCEWTPFSKIHTHTHTHMRTSTSMRTRTEKLLQVTNSTDMHTHTQPEA